MTMAPFLRFLSALYVQRHWISVGLRFILVAGKGCCRLRHGIGDEIETVS